MPNCITVKTCCVNSPKPRAIVDTVNESPKACTNSSRFISRAPKNGTAGITNTPVIPVINPVVKPIAGLIFF